MKKSNFLIIFLFLSCLILAQNKKLQQSSVVIENTILQTNSNFYLAGENIFYKLICINSSNNQISNFSKVAYIELIDKEKKSILKQKLILKEGIASNDFFLPTNIQSGYYKVVAYTTWMTNYNSFFEKDILIINPYTNIPEELKEKENNNKTIITTKNSNSNKKIKISKSIYTKREKVTFNVQEQLKGSFILNVNKIDSIPFSNEQNIFTALNKNSSPINLDDFKNAAENRGEIYYGKIESKSSDSGVENKKIAFSQMGDAFDLKISTTNSKGEFTIITDKTINNEGYIQVYEDDRSKYKIALNKFSISNLINENSFKSNKIQSIYGKAILNRSIANQIQNIYYHTKSDTIYSNPKTKPFYTGADKQYILSDYNPQNSLKEVFVEVIPEIYTVKKNGKSIMRVNDYEVNKSDLFENTIVLVDGFLLQEIDEILTYDPTYFTKINFVNKGYFLNKYIFNGIVNLTTKEQNYVPKISEEWIIKAPLEKPELDKKYFSIDYTKNTYDKIPDYRYQLVWEPNITELAPNKELSFFTSDLKGNYKISIEGITDTGEPVIIEEYIQVN
ncbi:Protein of unknown function precursor [Flavobacterium indicum GPTSA100-9 = DSM 17447]|uniref:Uncharacterized protein n=1 Tax=Flavobacterium indicum (strain DSM 17447 / CIP 109464 / GPTSA100-9) TaxID=1094466 RepID=H8XPY0_FLAIG|nr:hypothetical protein [Flavobacterium indicum]CCG54196.1 Protein of unknown function precursor [Flavobacterium indicum GPTSA100-9 = DSM 17447]